MEPRDPIPFEQFVGFRLVQLAARARLILRRTFLSHGYDVTPEQWGVINWLTRGEGLSQAQLAEDLLKDRPTMTRIIDSLEKRGYALRRRDPEDRRCYRIYLTDDGRQLRQKLYPIVHDLNTHLLAGIADEEIRGFESMLALFHDRMAEMDQ